jgi:hypothetical protein
LIVRLFPRAAIGLAVAGLSLLGPGAAQADIPELVATLTEAQVVGPYPPLPTGDGSVRIFLGSDPGIICFELRLSNMAEWAPFGRNAFSATIGKALPGAAGPTVATFPPISELPAPATISTGCISGLSPSFIGDLFTNPEQYYVEVLQLNPDAPACNGIDIPCIIGAIRGQLGLAPAQRPTSAPTQVPNTALAAGITARPAADFGASLGTLLILAALITGLGPLLARLKEIQQGGRSAR